MRELENAIERACALCEDGTIRVADLPPILRAVVAEGEEDVVETPVARPAPGAAMSIGGAASASASAPSAHMLSQPIGPLRNYLRDQELSYVNRALAQTGGDKEKAAEILGVSVATLYRKLAEEDFP